MKLFGREPALWLASLAGVLGLGAAFSVPGLSHTQTVLIVAALDAVLLAVAAFRVRPVAPAVFTAAVSAVAALVMGYGVDLSADQVASFNLAVLGALGLITREQVTPTDDANGGDVSPPPPGWSEPAGSPDDSARL